MKYIITGGVYTDFTFKNLASKEEYGPFSDWTEAYDVWKKHVWQNVDNALHRLEIKKAG